MIVSNCIRARYNLPIRVSISYYRCVLGNSYRRLRSMANYHHSTRAPVPLTPLQNNLGTYTQWTLHLNF